MSELHDRLAATLDWSEEVRAVLVRVVELATDAAGEFIDQDAYDRGWPIEFKDALRQLDEALPPQRGRT